MLFGITTVSERRTLKSFTFYLGGKWHFVGFPPDYFEENNA